MSRLTDNKIANLIETDTYMEMNIDDLRKAKEPSIQELYVRLNKYEKLEEKLGCPLEVYVRLVRDTPIYDTKGRKYYVKEIADYIGRVINVIWFTKIGEEIEHTFSLNEYKIKWFLKKDKSE